MNWMNESRQPFADMKNKEFTRHRLLKAKAKMLCKACDPPTVNPVVDSFPNGQCALSCGHRRKEEMSVCQ